MFIYILFIFFLLLSFFIPHNKHKNYLFSILLLIIFSAIRYDVGTDFQTYLNVTSGSTDIRISNFMLFEPLNVFLITVGYWIKSPQFYFITGALITNMLIYFTIKKYSTDKILSIMCYVGFPMLYLESMNIIRQFIAISIIIYSVRYIFDEKPFRFMLSVLIAVLFHFSAIIAVPLYYIYKKAFTAKQNLLLLIVSFFAGKLTMTLLAMLPYFSKLSYYLKTQQEGYFIVFVVSVILSLIHIMFYERLVAKDSRQVFYLGAFNFGLSVFFIFYEIPVIAGRFFFYFFAFLIFIVPAYKEIFVQKILLKTFLIIVFVFSFFFRIWYSSYLYKNNWMSKDPYIPYQTYFGKYIKDE